MDREREWERRTGDGEAEKREKREGERETRRSVTVFFGIFFFSMVSTSLIPLSKTDTTPSPKRFKIMPQESRKCN